MESEAYISSSFFDGYFHKHNILPISLIAYDKLYVHKDLDRIPWDYAKFLTSMHKSGAFNLEDAKRFQNEELDFAALTLATFLDCDSNVLTEISSHFADIRNHPSEKIREFINITITQPVLHKIGTPVFHGELVIIVMEYLHRINFNLNDPRNQQLTLIAIIEFFVTHYLSKHHNISPILNPFDLLIQKIISLLPTTPLSFNDNLPNIYTHFCDLETVQDMFSTKTISTLLEDVQVIMEISVPNFENIPLIEIAKLKSRNKFTSIAQLSERINEKRSVSNLDFTQIFVDELWKMGKMLSPNISENTAGVIGSIPLPIPVNPIGIASAVYSAKKFSKFKKDYKWFITLSELKEKSKNN